MSQMLKVGELFDWATVEPGVKKLLEEDPTPERVPEWLLDWSRLNDIIGKAFAAGHLAKDRDTSDKAAEKTTCV